jgi:chloramphenicol-sensitive protein RarD
MSPARKGYLFGLSAYLLWGGFPLYWKLLRPAAATEILAHRILWSFAFMLVVVAVGRGFRRIGRLLRQPRKVALVALAAVLIAINWGGYIYGVNTDRVVETSLGYFINPLVTVLLGVFVLRERLRVGQWAAIGIGAVAVGVLTVDYGHVPYLALTVAGSFGLYGLVKKQLAVPAVDGLLLESGALVLPAMVYIGLLVGRGQSTVEQAPAWHTAVLVLSGVVTAIPLLLFAGAANRIPLSAIGLLQYLAPILQLGIGVFVFDEPMPPARLAGFALVWVALVVFTWDGVRHRPARARPSPATPAAARV